MTFVKAIVGQTLKEDQRIKLAGRIGAIQEETTLELNGKIKVNWEDNNFERMHGNNLELGRFELEVEKCKPYLTNEAATHILEWCGSRLSPFMLSDISKELSSMTNPR